MDRQSQAQEQRYAVSRSTGLVEECSPDTLTSRTQRLMSQTGRIREALSELSARLVLPENKLAGAMGGSAPAPVPSHQQMCLEATEANLSAIEETISSLLTRI